MIIVFFVYRYKIYLNFGRSLKLTLPSVVWLRDSKRFRHNNISDLFLRVADAVGARALNQTSLSLSFVCVVHSRTGEATHPKPLLNFCRKIVAGDRQAKLGGFPGETWGMGLFWVGEFKRGALGLSLYWVGVVWSGALWGTPALVKAINHIRNQVFEYTFFSFIP